MTLISARRHLCINLFLLLIISNLIACSDEELPLEQQISQLNDRAELAAENKDIGALKDMVSDSFKSGPYDKKSIVQLVQLYMLRHRTIHLYSLTKSLQAIDENNAVAEILVAMAGQPIERADQLVSLRADLMRFNVSYARDEDEWKVIRTEWKRATVEDFL